MLKLLDTTLRDGSYVIDFQFTPKDTTLIAAKLDDAGVHYIEVGHGLGMNAGTKDNMRSAMSDEACLEATAGTVRKAKWGMFFIPGIGREEDIQLAAKYGMHFIRIGTNVTEIEQSEKYIRLAKDLGMFVCANYMKTYAVSPEEVGRKALLSANYGADMVCVVDSAGGMFPEDVEDYFNAIKNNSDVAIGFHGHNNLGLAIANTLKAIDLGAQIVDTSVRGMGRSSGNTVTEIFLLALKRKQIDLNINVNKILDLAEQHIDPLLKNYNQLDSIGIVSGFAQFHSSFLGKILSYATKHRIDPRELIVRLTSIDKVNAPDDLVEKLSLEIAEEQKGNVNHIEINFPVDKKIKLADSFYENAKTVAERTQSLAKKWMRISVMNLVQSTRPGSSSCVSNVINEGHNFIVSSAEVENAQDAEQLAKAIDGEVEYVLLDADVKTEYSNAFISVFYKILNKTKVLPYSDTEVWAKSIMQQALELLHGKISACNILIAGDGFLAKSLFDKLKIFGANVSFLSEEKSGNIDAWDLVIIANQLADNALNKVRYNRGATIIDGWVGSLSSESVAKLNSQEIKVIRAEMHHFIQAEIAAVLGTHVLINERQGYKIINGVPAASGGIIASAGTIIVDSVNKPSKVYGLADGRGFLLPADKYDQKQIENISVIENYIAFSAANYQSV